MRSGPGSGRKVLEGWKEIGAYLQRTDRTVRRWEAEEGLPVHRQVHRTRVTVYAHPQELDAWRSGRTLEPETPARPPWRRLAVSLAFAACLAVILLLSGEPPRVVGALSAQQIPGAGIQVRQIWANGSGSPSRDGRYLAFTNWETGNVTVRDLKTGDDRAVTRRQGGPVIYEYAQSYVFSPDGAQIAYEWVDKDYVSELRLVVPAEGGPSRLLLRAKAHSSELMVTDWSPDGKHLLVYSEPWPKGDHEILLVSVADGSTRTVKNLGAASPTRIRFSPDGKFVAYDHPQGGSDRGSDISAILLETNEVHALVAHRSDDRLLDWAPDGASILFLSNRSGSPGMYLLPVAEGRPRGEPSLIRSEVGQVRPLGFTSAGAYYYAYRDQGFNIRQAGIDLRAGKILGPAALLSEMYQGRNLEPQFSPDGTRAAFVRRVSPTPRLCIVTLATGRELELDPGLNVIRYPRWAPDGKSVLAVGDSKQGSGAYDIDAVSGNARFVCPIEENSLQLAAVWSPDKKAVLYTRGLDTGTQSQVVRCDAATREKIVLLESPKGHFFSLISLSPDGQWLGFRHWRGDNVAMGLVIAPVSGGSYREVSIDLTPDRFIRDLAWTGDSRSLAVLHTSNLTLRQPPSLTFVPVEGGPPRTIEVPYQGTAMFSLSPDGKRLLLGQSDWQSQTWALENFLPR